MLDPRFAFLADPKRNVAHNLVHDFLHGRRYLRSRRIRPNGEITAGDVEPNAGERDLIRVGDYAADRLRVTLVPIGAQDCALAAGFHAPLDLRDRRLIVLAKNLRLHPAKRRSAITRHASTSSRVLISAGLITAFTLAKNTSLNGSVMEVASRRFVSWSISL